MSLKYVQSNTLYQAGAGNIVGATTIVLTSLTDIYGNVLTMADFGSKGYITCEPDTTNEEALSFTGITANANGTYALTGVSTILAKSPYTETAGTVRAHSGGTKVVVTDNVGFWNTFINKNNDETVTGKYTFPNGANRPILDADTDTATAAGLVTLGQLSRQAISGASNASTTVKGIVELPTQAEVDARTTTGGTGALLAVTPDTLRSTKYSDYVADAGATDAYAISTTPSTTAYAVGQEFTFKANTANTGTASLNVNGLGAKTIKKNGGANDLDTGDIVANQDVKVIYDGTNMQMVSPTARQAITQDGAQIYAADAGASDTYTITLTPAPAAYVTGMVVNFKANTANTGAATLNVNGLGAKTIKRKGSVDLNDNDIVANQDVQVIYDGTNFQMLSAPNTPGGYEQVTNTGAGPTTIGGTTTVVVTCSAGKKVVGGGGSISGSGANPAIQASYPSSTTQWTVIYMGNANGAAGTVTAYAIAVDA